MYRKSILSSRRTGADLIEHEFFKGKNKPNGKHHYLDIRGAMVFPSTGVFGCFTIVGLQYAQHDPSDQLELLMEFRLEELSLEKLFNRLGEATSLYRVSPVYVDFDTPTFRPLQDYCQRTNVSIDYQDAVYKDDPRVQMAMARDLLRRGKLIVPDTSEIWAELDRLDLKDLSDDLLQRFPLACCLASVIAGFSAHPPSRPVSWQESVSEFAGVKGGWMMI